MFVNALKFVLVATLARDKNYTFLSISIIVVDELPMDILFFLRSCRRGYPHILLICVLALPGLAQAWSDVPSRGLPFDRNAQNMMVINEMQRRAYERDQEWRRRDDEQRRRVEEEWQREMWRRDEERRRENARLRDEHARDREQRRAHEERSLERSRYELLQRDNQKRKDGSHRESELRGKPLNPKELRRYELIRPGDRP